jgi:hypothetical protein
MPKQETARLLENLDMGAVYGCTHLIFENKSPNMRDSLPQ